MRQLNVMNEGESRKAIYHLPLVSPSELVGEA